MNLQAPQARARVAAKLRRDPRDVLEARVVLEAWGGVRPEVAKDVAYGAVARPDIRFSLGAQRGDSSGTGAPWHRSLSVMLIVSVLATAAWAGPAAAAAGGGASARAWQVALPASLSVQWIIARRHLALPTLAGLKAEPLLAPALVATCVVLAVTTVWRPSTGVPLALAVVWVVVPLLVRHGWWHVTTLILLGSAWAIQTTAAVPAVTGTAAVLLLALSAAVRGAPVTSRRLPPWRVTAPPALCAAFAGLLLALGPSRSWQPRDASVALTLAPSLLAAGVAGARLSGIWTSVPQALARVDVAATDGLGTTRRAARRALVVLLVQAFAVLGLVASAGSAVVLLLVPEREAAATRVALVDFAVFAFVLALAVAVEALAGAVRAVLVVVAANAGVVVAGLGEFDVVMVGAATAATTVAVGLLFGPIRAPDRAFARIL